LARERKGSVPGRQPERMNMIQQGFTNCDFIKPDFNIDCTRVDVLYQLLHTRTGHIKTKQDFVDEMGQLDETVK